MTDATGMVTRCGARQAEGSLYDLTAEERAAVIPPGPAPDIGPGEYLPPSDAGLRADAFEMEAAP